MATIENLSPEMLVMIFSHYVRSEGHEAFLRNIPLVCKHWRNLLTEAPLWRNVMADNWNFLLNLSRRGLLKHTQSLELDLLGGSSSFVLHDGNLLAVLGNIHDLRALVLKDSTVSSNALTLVTEHCPHLEHLCLRVVQSSNTTPQELDQFFTVSGPTLKHLELGYHSSQERGQQLVSTIAAKCPHLERFVFLAPYALIPIYELRRGCRSLRELELDRCKLINTGSNESLGCGFKAMKKFSASFSDFSGLDIQHLLKDSVDLEQLLLYNNEGLIFGNVSKIKSEKVRILDIDLEDPSQNVKALGDAVFKWRRTLQALHLRFWKYDIDYVLKLILRDNLNPPLEYLSICKNIDPNFLKEFIDKCQNLVYLKIDVEEFKGREKIKEASEFLMKEQCNT